VGGLPPELRAAALKLTLASVREREPFKGWIRDVRVNSSQALPVDSGEVKLDDEQPNSGGGSPCEAGEEGEGGVCLNGGVCSVVDDQAVCDCSRTGFRGKDCSQEDNNVEGLAHLMMGDQGKSKVPLAQILTSFLHILLRKLEKHNPQVFLSSEWHFRKR